MVTSILRGDGRSVPAASPFGPDTPPVDRPRTVLIPGTITRLPERNLDLLRAVAVLCVVVDHIWMVSLGDFRRDVSWAMGEFGVFLFFVHTSLVLMSSLERSAAREPAGAPDTIGFYTRRAFRIFPLAWAAIVAVTLFEIPPFLAGPGQPPIHFTAPSHKELIANLLLAQNVLGARDLQGPLWSLPVEVQMYLVLPALFVVARRSLRGTVAITVAAAVLAGLQWSTLGGMPVFWRLGMLRYAPCFMGGVLSYSLLRTIRGKPTLPAWSFPLALLVAALVFANLVRGLTPSNGWPACIVMGVAIPFISELGPGVLTKVARVVARYSYGVYLLHIPALWLGLRVAHDLPIGGRWSIAIAGIVLLPVLAYHAIEEPAIRIGQRLAEWRFSDRSGSAVGYVPSPGRIPVYTRRVFSRLLARMVIPFALIALPGQASAQRATGSAASPTYDSLALASLEWREIGPFRGGRSVAVAGSVARPREYYLGSTGGGVLKTVDGGITWHAITDRYFGGTIGAIAVAPSNPDIVYVGTGEYPIRGNVSHGDGVFKSTDGGKTWIALGLADAQQISRVRIDPRNPDIVYVGAQGHVWGPNSTRGVYKSTDGGKSWRRVLYRNDSTGVTDLVMDPADPATLYAAFWEAYRKPWKLVSGGPGSGIFKSTDGGEHWTEITRNPGLPHGVIGNIGLAVSPVKPERVWAIVEADSGGVFRSDDGGRTWARTNADRKLRQRAWYYSRIFADPKDANTVYVLNVGFFRSTDGGKTFKPIRTPHGDNHDLWIAPDDPRRMIEGNDGGASVSLDGGKSWTPEAQATAQFYHVTTTTHFPYRVCGAQQDNSTLCGPSRRSGGISISDWYPVGGGESGYIAVRPDSPNVVYAGSYGGLLTRTDTRTGLSRDVNPWPDNPMGHDAADARYRFQWTFPIVLSPFDPNVLYAGSNVLFRSTNGGQSWAAISPDLTRHDPATLGPSGGPITKDQTSVEYYATIFTVAESPVARGTIWAGSDDGMVHVTRDGWKSWTDVTPRGLPPWARISMIEPSHFAAGTAYLAANRYQLEDMRPYLYRTTDYGRSWTPIVAGIPAAEFTRVIREDPERRGLLYAGTERGVWVSFDDGGHWQSLRRNLPPVPVHDLAVAHGDLVAATHGRSFWIMDDIAPLRQLTPAVVGEPVHLFQPRRVRRAFFPGSASDGSDGHPPRAANPPSGAIIHYWLSRPNLVVTLDFLDPRGSVIRHFTSVLDSAGVADSVARAHRLAVRHDSLVKAGVGADSIAKLERASEETVQPGMRGAKGPPRVSNRRGLNTFVWDLRYPDAVKFRGMILWAGETRGPVVLPGEYVARLTAGGVTRTARFTVLPDPRAGATQRDLEEQFQFLMRLRDTLSAANNAVRTIRNVRAQVAARDSALAGVARDSLRVIWRPLNDRLVAIEEAIYQTRNRANQDPLNYPIRLNNKIAALAGVVGSAAARPTAQSYAVFRVLAPQLDARLRALQAVLRDLTPVNAFLARHGARAIVPSTAELGARPAAGDREDDEGGERDEGARYWLDGATARPRRSAGPGGPVKL